MKLPSLNTPGWLQIMQWISDPVNYMESAYRSHGDIFETKINAKTGNMVFVANPEAIQQIFSNDRKQFKSPGAVNRLLEPMLGDYSIIMLDSDRHKRERKLLMPPFHGEQMQTYGESIYKLTEKVFDRLSTNEIFSARDAMQDISLQVILEVVFGLYEGERYQQLKQLLTDITNIFRSPLAFAFLVFPSLQKDLGAWSPWGRFVRLREQIDRLLYAEIAERRQQQYSQNKDILSLLMSARDEQGNAMTDRELRDELMTLLFAGHETTATAMSWVLYWIHRLPDVRDRLVRELNDLGTSFTSMDIARLPYLTAVCQESLRIYPVGILTFPRVVQEKMDLNGYDLEPGTILAGCIYLTHQREDIYPQPTQFKPERFLERQYSPYEFIPFGGGARRCIGDALAQFEMKLVIATIISRYQLKLASDRPEKPQRRGVTLVPANGVKMSIEGRRQKSQVTSHKSQVTR